MRRTPNAGIIWAGIAALTAQLGCSASTYGRVEGRAGYESATADVQAGFSKGIDFFARSKTTKFYGIPGAQEFAYADVSKEVAHGIAPVLEGQLFMPDVNGSETDVHARAGALVAKQIDDFKFFGILTGKLERPTDIEGFINSSYALGRFTPSLEAVTNWTPVGEHNLSTGRFSLPITLVGKCALGPFIEAAKFGREKTTYHGGIGLSIDLP